MPKNNNLWACNLDSEHGKVWTKVWFFCKDLVIVMHKFTIPHTNIPTKQATDHILQGASSLNPKSFTARDLCDWFKDIYDVTIY